ncbi:MAG TPA: TIGR00725 family protein [Solirubrobacteraceae bacterium]|nr:TIGR00725 family protein [Solirubrobacteraceae bacterium]
MAAAQHPPPHIAVVGPDTGALPSELESAEAVGAGLARAGAVLVCGGLGGVMEAACRGARAEGGLTVGILPGQDRSSANPHVQVAIPTGMGELRNGLVVRAADALIAIGGAYGTLSEVALALKGGLAVVGLGTWELSRQGRTDRAVLRVAGADQAVALALRAVA